MSQPVPFPLGQPRGARASLMAYRVRIVYIGPELLVGDSFVGWHYRDGNGTKKENPQLHPKPFVKIGGGGV